MRPLILLLAVFLGWMAWSRVADTRPKGAYRFPTRDSHERIDLRQEGSIARWCRKLGCTEPQLRRAVNEVGYSAEAVRAHLVAQAA
jgi:hypothetical protein